MSAITAASDDEMQAEIERLRAENESLKQQLEDEKQARKTWENEAERRSDRYTNDVAALQQQLAQRVPDGSKLVPVEPTDAMVQAAHHLDLSYMPGQEGADRAAIYRAMIHAAPAQPEQPAAQDKPFAYYQPNCPTNIMEAKLRDMEASRSDTSTMIAYAKACTEPLYARPAQQTAAVQQDRMVFCTYPSCHGEGKTCTGPCATQPIQKAAQQTKPQPLSDEQVDQLYEAAVKARKFVTRQDFELGIRHAEAAHGIKE